MRGAVPAGSVRISARADDATRPIATAQPVAAAATAHLCGAGYEPTSSTTCAGRSPRS